MAWLKVPKETAQNLLIQRATEVLGYKPDVWQVNGEIRIGRRDPGGFFSTTQVYVSLPIAPNWGHRVDWHEEALDHKSGDDANAWNAVKIALAEGWKKLKDTGAIEE